MNLVSKDDIKYHTCDQVQGPWGSPTNGREFFDMATSITGIELRYSEGVGPVGLFKVTYELLGKTFTRESYVKNASHGQILEKVIFTQSSSFAMLGFF